MARSAPRIGRSAAKDVPALITDAHTGTSRELSSRERRYAWTMAFRTACFVGMIFVSGWLRWVLFACAVLLPYVAVLFANQRDDRARTFGVVTPGAPLDAPRLTSGPEPDLITGSVEDEQASREDRVA